LLLVNLDGDFQGETTGVAFVRLTATRPVFQLDKCLSVNRQFQPIWQVFLNGVIPFLAWRFSLTFPRHKETRERTQSCAPHTFRKHGYELLPPQSTYYFLRHALYPGPVLRHSIQGFPLCATLFVYLLSNLT